MKYRLGISTPAGFEPAYLADSKEEAERWIMSSGAPEGTMKAYRAECANSALKSKRVQGDGRLDRNAGHDRSKLSGHGGTNPEGD